MTVLAAFLMVRQTVLAAATYTIDIPVAIAAVIGTFTLVVMVAAAISLSRSATLKATLETQSASLESITLANVELRQVIADQERAFNAELRESEKRVAALEGRLQAVTADLGHMIVEAVIHTVREAQNLPFFPDPPLAGD